MVVLRRLVPDSFYPARLGCDPRLAVQPRCRARSTIALTTAAVLKAISILSQRSVNATFSGWSQNWWVRMPPSWITLNRYPTGGRKRRWALEEVSSSLSLRFCASYRAPPPANAVERRRRPTAQSHWRGRVPRGHDPPSAWVSIVVSTAFAIALTEPFAPSSAPPRPIRSMPTTQKRLPNAATSGAAEAALMPKPWRKKTVRW